MLSKNNKKTRRKKIIYIYILVIFVVWISVLLSLFSTSSREFTFFDVITLTDVSNDYNLAVPLWRYILEPLCFFAFETAKDFENMLLLYLMIYAVFRISFLIIDKFTLHNQLKTNKKLRAIKTALDFSTIVFFILIIISVIILGTALALNGFIAVADSYSLVLQIVIHVTLVTFFIKLIHNIIRIWKNPEKIRVKQQRQEGILHRVKEIFWEFLTLIEVYLLVVMIIFSLISAPLPTQRIDTDLNTNEFLFDFHVHTIKSDGFLSPQERVRWYISQGIQGAAFSDHHNSRGAQLALKYVEENDINFSVWIAQEYTSPELHLNIYGIEEAIIPVELTAPEGTLQLNVSDMIAYVKSNDGFVTVNHYNSPAGAPYSYEQLRDWGVDGFEVANEGRMYPAEIRQFCLDNNLACMGGSDIHSNEGLPTFVRINLPDPTNHSLDYVFAELKKNTHQVINIETDSNELPDLFEIFESSVNYFLNLDTFQILSWILWSSGAFIVAISVLRMLLVKKEAKMAKKNK